MGKRSSRRIAFSLLLIGLLLAGLLPVAGIAQNDSDKEVIVSFDTPVTELTVPLGTKIADIPLPETLAAALAEGAVADIPITWETDGYHRESAGTYLFTADIGTWVYPQARPVAVVTVVPPGRNINGMLWLDKNGDGIKDVGETGIAGYPVTLYAEDNLTDAVWDTLTKTDGTYRFEGMEPGSYVVKVASETIGGTEYLLPWTIANDNKFEMDEEAVGSWSAPLEITEDTVISGIDAGMRLPEGIKPRLTISVDNFDDLRDFFWPFLNDGDTVIIEKDIEFTSTLVVKKNITIKAPDNGDSVKLTSKTQRHFTVPAGSDVTLNFENIVLDGGRTGGGIEIKGGLTLSGAEITNCFANQGGGIFAAGAKQINLSDCKIYENIAKNDGGGVYAETTPCMIEECEIYKNSTENSEGLHGGGGVCLTTLKFTIQDSRIYENESASWGGGLFAIATENSTITDCEIYGNTAIDGGGIFAITAMGAAITVHNSSVNDNKAANNGGGIHSGFLNDYLKDTALEITGDSQISKNTADNDGGGVYVCNGTFTMKSSEISGNKAITGGGIYTYNIEKLSIATGVTFSGNEASIAAKPLSNMTVNYPQIAATSSSIYDHPLNNYDINVLVVTVHYVDSSGNSIGKLPVGYAVVTGATFTLPHEEISTIPGYVGWRQGTSGTLQNSEVPVTLPNVMSGSSIYLVYARSNVTVSSVVSGDYADKTRDFTFTIKFADASGSPLTGELAYTGDILPGLVTSIPDDGILILNSSGEAAFTLHHGQVITIKDVPANAKVWIRIESVIGYTTAWQDGAAPSVLGDSTGELAMSVTDRTIAFTNTYDDVVPTGIRTDDTGALLLAGVSILLLAVSLIRRRGQKGVLN